MKGNSEINVQSMGEKSKEKGGGGGKMYGK